jgi:threonine dehydratase
MGRISVENIAEASQVIDPVFRDTPQFVSEALSERLGATVVLKVETVNPIRSFKGRGTDYLLHELDVPAPGLVCASAGNFGQGLAYAGRKRGHTVTVFAAVAANPLKVQRMRALGAEVVLEGDDFEAAKRSARRHADAKGALFIEDGVAPAIAEGAGTIAVELCRMEEPLDFLLVPLGDGALIAGVATWMRQAWPETEIVGVVATGAPAMLLSWREGHVVSTPTTDTIADGIAVRAPIPDAFAQARTLVEHVVSVSEDEILAAMRVLHRDAGLVVEPAGAAGLAAIDSSFAHHRVGVIVTGGNITDEQAQRWLLG